MSSQFEPSLISDIYNKCKDVFASVIDPQIHASAYTGEHDIGFAESEFAGKYIDICVQMYKYTGDKAVLNNAKTVVDSIITNQREDGYSGGYKCGLEWANFSVWNQAFTIYGLISYWEITKSQQVLDAAEKCMTYTANHFMNEGADILDADNYGTQHASILIALPRLYKITKKKIYLDFINHIFDRLKNSDNNFFEFDSILDLRSKKAIENFVIILGLIMCGEVIGDNSAIKAAAKYWKELDETQIRETGNGTNAELWFENGNAPAFLTEEQKPNENCVAVGWCELSYMLFKNDRKSVYLDAIEKTLFNHLLGSLDEQCHDFAYYQPNFGKRVTRTVSSAYKCCRYRGFSAISFLPKVLFDKNDDCITPMIYTNSKFEDDNLQIEEKTNYPFDDTVEFDIVGKKATVTMLKLRIPCRCKSFDISVNGETVKVDASDGYVILKRQWTHDSVKICFNTNPVLKRVTIDGKSYVSITYGNVLLVQDSHFGNKIFDTQIDAENVKFERVANSEYNIEFTVDGYEHGKAVKLHFVNYASAGKKSADDEYSVWTEVL